VMGLPGKPDGMTGAEVEKYYGDGRIREIADTVRAMYSTRIGYGSDMNCFAGDCRMATSRQARPS
jgi:hypothetical protein